MISLGMQIDDSIARMGFGWLEEKIEEDFHEWNKEI